MTKRSRGSDRGDYYDEDSENFALPFVFVPAKGFETTHEVLCVPSKNRPVVRSKLTGRHLKISKAGRVLMCPARKWEYVDALVPSSAARHVTVDNTEDETATDSDSDKSTTPTERPPPSWAARLFQCLLCVMLTLGTVMVLAAAPPDEKMQNTLVDFARSTVTYATSLMSRMVAHVSPAIVEEAEQPVDGDTWM